MNILQTYRSASLPPSLQTLSDKVKKKNPRWNYMFFSDDDIVEFFQEKLPEYRETFENLALKIQQLDFFRYAAVYHYGGVYLDMDVDTLEPFDNGIDLDYCYFPLEYLKNTDAFLLDQGIRHLLGNYAFYAPAGHPFLKAVLDNIVTQRVPDEAIRAAQKGRVQKDSVRVFFTTGPILVTQTHADYHGKEAPVRLLTPEPFEQNCFGRYARHLSMGSWKRSPQDKLQTIPQ